MDIIVFQRGNGDEGEADAEAEDMESPLPNLMELTHYFEQAGVGLSREELVRVWLALKTLNDNHPLQHIRFWGKLFGTEQNYYVAEVEYREGEDEEEEEEEVAEAEEEDTPEKDEEGEDEGEEKGKIKGLFQCSALSISQGHFSSANSQKTAHSSPVRARYGLSFVSQNSEKNCRFPAIALYLILHYDRLRYIKSL